MTQTAMFPNPKLLPNMATQAFLYYNSTMGTLTEVDLGASGPGIPAAPPLVLTSPADLAAFTGNYRIPTSVVESAGNGYLSPDFNTQTPITITVTYHYIPNLPSLDPPSSPSPDSPGPSVPSPSPTNAAPAAPTGTVSDVQAVSAQPQHSSSHAREKKPMLAAISSHESAHHRLDGLLRPRLVGHSSRVKMH